MPTNQQRRDAAKRKLERQLVHRQEQAEGRRQRTIIGRCSRWCLLTVGIIWFVTAEPLRLRRRRRLHGETAPRPPPRPRPTTPCSYPASSDPAVKDVDAPTNTNPARIGPVDVTITLGQGPITATLDRELAPCAVNAFVSLAAQKFYDDTDCHRLTTSETFKILQCGDPSGTGRGGPGYTREQRERQRRRQHDAGGEAPPPSRPSRRRPAPLHYPVGTLAMASTAPAARTDRSSSSSTTRRSSTARPTPRSARSAPRPLR